MDMARSIPTNQAGRDVLENIDPSFGVTQTMLDTLNPEEQEELLRLLTSLVGGERIVEWIQRIFPHEPVPDHMMPVIEVMEQARVTPIRVCLSVGPGHAKTTLLLRCLIWWLSLSPADQCAYITYSSSQAHDKSRIAQGFAEAAGLPLMKNATAMGHWHTAAGGGVIAAGSRGKLTGQRIPGLVLYDDPYKDEFEARSAAINNQVKERFKAIAFTRLQGGSVVVLHTRWAEDDLIGWLTRDLKWDNINIPTVCDQVPDILGRQLDEVAWPDHYPYEICTTPCGHDGHLREIRETIGEHLWAAMYQGRPRPLGKSVFHEPARYRLYADKANGIPSEFTWVGKRGVISIDPAATASTSADWSVLLVCAVEGFGINTKMWIVDCVRRQQEIPELVQDARRLQQQYRLMVACEAIAGFKAVPQSLRRIDAKLRVIDITTGAKDKFTRAMAISAAWNAGRVMVPMDAPWADTLIDEYKRFTGSGDRHDDQVDAGAHAWNILYRSAPKITQSDYAEGGV